ncbi:hypothetical protein MMC13_008195 [Lambiella insularis]|nr:hypothetical protein [Lambiella insularis]
MTSDNTFRAALHDGERYWAWKLALRVITIVLALVSIGLLAWASSPYNQVFSYEFWLVVWEFIPLGISIIWNVANIIVLLVRKRPMHPGTDVGVDLLLWLALIAASIFAMFAAISELQWQYLDYDYSEPTNEFNYVQLPNGTYGYVDGHYVQALNGSSYYVTGNSSDPIACDGFASCAEENQLFNQHHNLGVIELVGAIFSCIIVLLHFTLFVWACVDTHNRRGRKVDKRATKLAQSMIAEMTERGILPAPQHRQQEEGLLAHNADGEREASVIALPRVSESRDIENDGDHAEESSPAFPARPDNYMTGGADTGTIEVAPKIRYT